MLLKASRATATTLALRSLLYPFYRSIYFRFMAYFRPSTGFIITTLTSRFDFTTYYHYNYEHDHSLSYFGQAGQGNLNITMSACRPKQPSWRAYVHRWLSCQLLHILPPPYHRSLLQALLPV